VCTIDRLNVSELDQRFRDEYYLVKPVILREWRVPATEALRHHLDRGPLLAGYGTMAVQVGAPVEIFDTGKGSRSVSLKEFVDSFDDNSEDYLFGGGFLQESGLTANWTTPPVFASLGTYDDWEHDLDGIPGPPLDIAMAQDGQGIGFHTHNDAYNLQVHGSKRWAIYGPHLMKGVPTGPESLAFWLQELRDGDGIPRPTWECVQEPGEVLYVPEGFPHTTASILESVGIAHRAELLAESSARKLWFDAGSEDDPKRSLQMLKRATQMDSSSIIYWMALQEVYNYLGDVDNAVKALYRAREINPRGLGVVMTLCDVLRSNGRHLEARRAGCDDVDSME